MWRSIQGALLAITLCLACSSAAAKPGPKTAPAFDLQSLQGPRGGKLKDLRGKVVVLEFWATYCGWCKRTHPKLAAFAKKYGDEVAVLGITAQRKSRVLRYLRRHDTGLQILHDPGARVSRDYRADATPTLVVIDAEGIVRAWAQGGHRLEEILKVARSLM